MLGIKSEYFEKTAREIPEPLKRLLSKVRDDAKDTYDLVTKLPGNDTFVSQNLIFYTPHIQVAKIKEKQNGKKRKIGVFKFGE